MGLINKSVPKCVKFHSTRTAKIANVCMLSQFSHVQLFVTPWAIACQAPLSMGYSRQECWSGLPCSPLEDLPDPCLLQLLHCSVQSLSHVWLFATPWTAACQAFLSITNSRSPPKPMSIESVMPSSHLILCRPLLLLPSIFHIIRVFSNESALLIKVVKVLEFQLQHQSLQWTPRTDLL